MSCGVGCRWSSKLSWLWLWLWSRLAAPAPISLETSIRCMCDPKKQKKNKKIIRHIIQPVLKTHHKVRSHEGALISLNVTLYYPKSLSASGWGRCVTSSAVTGTVFHSFSSLSCAFLHQLYGLLPVGLSPSQLLNSLWSGQGLLSSSVPSVPA